MSTRPRFFHLALSLCWGIVLLVSCSPYISSTIDPTMTATSTTIPATSTNEPTATSPPLPTCAVRTGIPAGALNMRAGAGMSHAVVRVLSEGEILQVLERAQWLKVIDTNGNRGFINSKYCK